MTLNITIPENISDTKPKISVIGIGGAGGNAVNTMINEKIENIDFIVANTDGQALSRSLTSRQIQLCKNITLGLGAGSDAETGKKAADESIEEIIAELSDVNMLFITQGGRWHWFWCCSGYSQSSPRKRDFNSCSSN